MAVLTLTKSNCLRDYLLGKSTKFKDILNEKISKYMNRFESQSSNIYYGIAQLCQDFAARVIKRKPHGDRKLRVVCT